MKIKSNNLIKINFICPNSISYFYSSVKPWNIKLLLSHSLSISNINVRIFLVGYHWRNIGLSIDGVFILKQRIGVANSALVDSVCEIHFAIVQVYPTSGRLLSTVIVQAVNYWISIWNIPVVGLLIVHHLGFFIILCHFKQLFFLLKFFVVFLEPINNPSVLFFSLHVLFFHFLKSLELRVFKICSRLISLPDF